MLFTLPSSEIPPLSAARNRLQKAQAEADKYERAKEELPISTAVDVLAELNGAYAALEALEMAELNKSNAERTGGTSGAVTG